MEILLDTHYRNWYTGNNVYSIGYAFVGEQLMKDEVLCSYLKEQIINRNLSESLKELNGSFAVIIKHCEVYYLIVDQIRSYPLLYNNENKQSFVTDNVERISDYLRKCECEETAIAEFLSMGYLSGNKTLFVNIKNIEAGSYVVLSDFTSQVITYHRHVHFKFKENSDQELINLSVNVLENAFKRMLKTIEGRQIVIPLSGGYDSRLLACLCKKFGITNVVCFTYGDINSIEVEISKQVADKLGFKWYYVEYTDKMWGEICTSKLYMEYQKFAGNLNAVPCIQDFPAVKYLIEKNILDNGAVVLPGHSADLLGGSHLPAKLDDQIPLSSLLFRKYYGINQLICKYMSKIMEELKRVIEEQSCEQDDDVDLFNNWGIKVRQANFIVNSVRVYEFFGLDWRIPFWDTEFVTFWESIPWCRKVNSELFNRFMFENYFNIYGVDYNKTKIETGTLRKLVLRLLPEFIVVFLVKFKQILFGISANHDPNSFRYIVDFYNRKGYGFKDYIKTNPTNVNAVLAIDYLRIFISK